MSEIWRKKNSKYLRINIATIPDNDHLIKKSFACWHTRLEHAPALTNNLTELCHFCFFLGDATFSEVFKDFSNMAVEDPDQLNNRYQLLSQDEDGM